MLPFIVVIVSALLLFIVSRVIYDTYQDQIPGKVLLLYLTGEIIVTCSVLSVCLPVNKLFIFVIFPLWIPNILVMSYIITGYVGYATVGAMFFPQMDKPVKNKLGAMKSLLWDEDIPGAVKACLDQFEQYPDEYDILLDGAALLCDRGSYLEALNLLQKTSNTFPEDKTAWSQATYRAATIRIEQLDDKEQACALFRKVAERMPDSEVGMRARERMHGDKPTVQRPEGESWSPQKQAPQREEKGAEKDADPFYRKRSARHPENNEEPDTPKPASPSLEDEMPGMFLDDDIPIH